MPQTTEKVIRDNPLQSVTISDPLSGGLAYTLGGAGAEAPPSESDAPKVAPPPVVSVPVAATAEAIKAAGTQPLLSSPLLLCLADENISL